MIKSNIGKIDFAHNLRGIAALFVIIAHLVVMFWVNQKFVTSVTGFTVYSGKSPFLTQVIGNIQFFNFGCFGVALFFLISGFVIPFSFEKQSSLQFLIGRFFRIWPTYIVGLTIGLLALKVGSYYFHTKFFPSLKTILSSFLIGQDYLGMPTVDGVIWTLEIEIKFYLLLAIVPSICRYKLSRLAIVSIVVTVFSLGFHNSSNTILKAFALDGMFITFMFIGVIFNYFYNKKINNFGFIICIFSLLAFFLIERHYLRENYFSLLGT